MNFRRFAVVISLCTYALAEAFPPQMDQEKASIKGISQSWRRREKQLGQGHFEWRDRIFIPKDERKTARLEKTVEAARSQGGERGQSRAASLSALANQAAKDWHLDNINVLRFREASWRLDCFRVKNEAKEAVETIVFHEGTQKIFMPGQESFPTGIIERPDEARIPKVDSLRTLFMLLRPISSATIIPEQFELSADQEVVGNAKCVILHGRQDTKNAWHFYLAPEMDYALVRWTVTSGQTVSTKLEVAYSQDAQHGWVPSEWKLVTTRANGELAQETVSSMTKWEIGAGADLDDFRFDFPARTLVNDYTRKSKSGEPKSFIAREGGVIREIQSNERDAGYDKWVAPESGNAASYQGRASLLWTAVTISGCVAIALAAFALFKRTKTTCRDKSTH